jgi:uncharacterized lipoprotein YbaY
MPPVARFMISWLLSLTLVVALTGDARATDPASEPRVTAQELEERRALELHNGFGVSRMGQISGNVLYRERIALTPHAVVDIVLQDVSRADTRAEILGTQQIRQPGQIPIPFLVKFDPDRVVEQNSYALRAEIHDRGRLLFTTDTHIPVLTRNAGNEVDLTLVLVTSSPQDRPGTPSPDPE